MHSIHDHKPQILFIDDEKKFQDYLNRHLGGNGFNIVTFSHWNEVQVLIEQKQVDPEIIFVEPLSQDGGSLKLEQIFSQIDGTPLVVLSALRDPKRIVEALRLGARDYLCKPVDAREIHRAIEKVLENRTTPPAVTAAPARKTRKEKVDFIYCNPKMGQIHDKVKQIAKVPISVLLLGESGVGKDVVARMIHQHSHLADKPFVKVNCAALPQELTESELFGYEKGAFTGACTSRPGKFEVANGGTIFLDEIGEFSPSVQAKLLQVLQDKRFTRLGSNRETQVDVRIIAATNRKLEEAIEKGAFREDLYYRLNVVNIELPPLRQRKDEILPLCDYFLEKCEEQYHIEIKKLPQEACDLFLNYHWPGNVRELENMVKRYVVLQDLDSIRGELERKMSRHTFDEVDDIAEKYLRENDDQMDLKEITKRAAEVVEKDMITRALNRTHWNKWQAAKALRVSYKTLLTKIDQHHIVPGSESRAQETCAV